MIKYRVNTKDGYTEFLEKNSDCIAFHAQHGVGDIEEIEIDKEPFNIEKFTIDLSLAFDLKFQQLWRAKGYTDISDLISHTANPESIYNEEALSLIKWSHVNWGVSITGINENSNIETIINSLPDYE